MVGGSSPSGPTWCICTAQQFFVSSGAFAFSVSGPSRLSDTFAGACVDLLHHMCIKDEGCSFADAVVSDHPVVGLGNLLSVAALLRCFVSSKLILSPPYLAKAISVRHSGPEHASSNLRVSAPLTMYCLFRFASEPVMSSSNGLLRMSLALRQQNLHFTKLLHDPFGLESLTWHSLPPVLESNPNFTTLELAAVMGAGQYIAHRY